MSILSEMFYFVCMLPVLYFDREFGIEDCASWTADGSTCSNEGCLLRGHEINESMEDNKS